MSDYEALVEQAAEAMRNNGRIPEVAVLRVLGEDMLLEIIKRHSDPRFIVA